MELVTLYWILITSTLGSVTNTFFFLISFCFYLNAARILSLMYLWEIFLKILEMLLQRDMYHRPTVLRVCSMYHVNWLENETKNCLPRVNRSW